LPSFPLSSSIRSLDFKTCFLTFLPLGRVFQEKEDRRLMRVGIRVSSLSASMSLPRSIALLGSERVDLASGSGTANRFFLDGRDRESAG